MNNDEYTQKRDNVLTLLELAGVDKQYVAAVKEAMDMAYEMGFEEGYGCGANNASTGE